ncbi:ABC transporter permease subunit [uncultured Demequina sp.]|uniref:ABC transporter permease subunit n=1 Tax=uncultured Demequina sp. TaxID=693499 RepID=UPI0025D83C52|nr:ABC transporter permease subunit [uncultured Demequina sp.]
MLATVYLKSVRDRWMAAAIAVVSLFAIAWMGMWAYAGMGDEATDFVASMPEAYLSLLGITADSGVAGMMLSNMFNFLGPFVIAGIGISMGAAAIAGEESAGTMNVLGTLPRSRSRLLTSKSLAILTIAVGSAVVTGLSYTAAVTLSGTELGSLDLAAATLHMLVVCLLFGALALAVGTWTGNRALASGLSVGLIVASFLVAGLLPLFDGLADWAKLSPWYWIAGTQPLTTGVDWVPLLVLLAATLGLAAVAWWGLSRRDLGSGATRTPVIERLREDPRIGRAVAMLAGRGSTRGVAAKALTDLRPYMVLVGGLILLQATVLGPMFTAISDTIGDVVNAMPESLLAMIGYADFSTPEGWYYGELLSIVAPVAVAVVAINAGASLVREEKNRTSNVLLSLPLARGQVAVRKAIAILTGSLVVGAAVVAGISAGNAIAGLGMSYGSIAAAGLLTAGLGCLLGAVAFVAGGITGSSSIAVGAGTGVAILGWGINSFIPVNPDLADWARVSPFYYYSTPNPLVEGMTWSNLGVLAGVAAVLVGIGVVAYRARDLRG